APFPELRQQARDALEMAEASPATRIAVSQAKLTVRARIAEGMHRGEDATTDYQAAIDLDPNSPLASYARDRLLRVSAIAQTSTSST
ncbi:MAG TPA: hypothetical protein VIY86_02690, partial [Pirellulaceae bacterium]